MTKVTDLIERLKDDSSDLVYHERHEAAAELLRLSSECEALREALERCAECDPESAMFAAIALQETNGGEE